jgi:hypothetical protein
MKSLISLTILVFAISAYSQAPTLKIQTETDRHADNVQRFQHLKISSPARVTFYDGKTLEIVEEDGKSVLATSLFIDIDSHGLDLLKDTKDKKFWIIYCEEHKTLYFTELYLPKK